MQYLSSNNYITFSPWDRHQIHIKLGGKYVIYCKLGNFIETRIPMLADSKVSSLACKCVF